MERLTEQEQVTMYVLNVNQYSATARDYGISSTPTVIRFVGGREQLRLVGFQDEATWLRLLQLDK